MQLHGNCVGGQWIATGEGTADINPADAGRGQRDALRPAWSPIASSRSHAGGGSVALPIA